MRSPIVLAVDIGGTFTDLVLLDANRTLWELKVSTSSSEEARSVILGTVELLKRANVDAGDVSEVIHASTVGSNAILEQKGPSVALLTTEGFRDILEIARIRTPRLYDLSWQKPRPLVPRRHRFEVRERIGASGEVVVPLEEASAIATIELMKSLELHEVAICLINSPLNDSHERRLLELFESRFPEARVSLSSVVLNELMEYERTSTTVINAFLQPVMRRYLEALERELVAIGLVAPMHIVRSDGGMMSVRAACDRPVSSVMSGPAAGVVAAKSVAERIGRPDVLAFDMGGTTAKASIIEDFRLPRISEYEVRDGISSPSRFIKAGGFLLRVPAIDIAEVGNGAGSIARVDSGGALRIGPQSAGAVPGPACYGRGGDHPTVTDANVMLGYLSPTALVGGELDLDSKLALAAVRDHVATPLGLDPIDAAWGIHDLANSNMIRAIRAVSVERGRDARTFSLLAFGGSGPVHAAGVAQSMHIAEVIVPRLAGLLSAVGLLASSVEEHVSRAWKRPVTDVDDEELMDAMEPLGVAATESLEAGGYESIEITYLADLQFAGQANVQTIELPSITGPVIDVLMKSFRERYETMFGHYLEDEPVEFVTLRAVATVPSKRAVVVAEDRVPESRYTVTRKAYFGPGPGFIDTPVISRAGLKESPTVGPLIVEEYDTTVVIPPGCLAIITPEQDIVIGTGE